MCNCITEMDERLKSHNTRLSIGFSINMKTRKVREYPAIMTEKIEKRSRQKQAQPIPTFCPFCGEKYADEATSESAE